MAVLPRVVVGQIGGCVEAGTGRGLSAMRGTVLAVRDDAHVIERGHACRRAPQHATYRSACEQQWCNCSATARPGRTSPAGGQSSYGLV